MALYHTTKGPVDYTIVGSPTIVDGVASGFSNSDYLTLPSLPTLDNLVMQISFTTGNEIENCYVLMYRKVIQLRITATGGLCSYNWNNSTDQFIIPKGQVETNTKYIVRIIKTGDTFHCSYNKNNGPFVESITYTYQNAAQDRNPFIGYWNNLVFQGSIDLNETYIKVNGQPWFGVCPVEVQKHQLKGPVGYEVVGNPTIVDGIASGFSNEDYFNVINPKKIMPNEDFEIVVSFLNDASTLTSDQFLLATYVLATGRFGLYLGTGTRRMYMMYTIPGQASPKYFNAFSSVPTGNITFKLAKNGTNITGYASTDGGNTYTEGNTLDTTVLGYLNQLQNWTIGQVSGGNIWKGTIDLNNTYIKVNGKLWFYQPADTKYIVKDGKLVWADPRIYLQSQSSANEVHPYIDTGYIPTVNTTYKWTAQFLINTGFVFGANSGDVIQNKVGHNYASSKDFVWTTIGYQGRVYGVGTTFLSKYTSHTDTDGYCYLNGTQVGKMTAVAGETTKHIWLFGTSANDGSETGATAGTRGYSARIYNFKLYESGLLVRDFVPVPAGLKIGSFTAPSNGMFDIVNQQFYGKVGSSLYDFTIGRDE